MASLPTLNSVSEIENAITDLNFHFQRLQRYPNNREKKQTKTVFFTAKANAGVKMCDNGYLGTLTFKQKLYDIYPHNCTKVLLQKWLQCSEWIECPICTVQMTTNTVPKYKKIGCSSCGRCGFKVCVICILKSVLLNDRTVWKCPNCRTYARLDIARFSANVIRDNHLPRFTHCEQTMIKSMAIQSELFGHYLKESKTVPNLQCSNCCASFARTRLKCMGCQTVYYCSKECQIENWKRCHKPWCHMFAFIKEAAKI